ncbi:zinc finger protein 862-like isoform X2 [Antedon mediterranea]
MRIHYLYRNSPKRLRELREIGRRIEKTVVKPPKASGTRWIAHRLAATEAMMRNIHAITVHLEDQASGQRRDIRGDDQNRIKGYLKTLKSEKFKVYIHLYAVILRILARLSLSLQKTGRTVGEVKVEVMSCMAEMNALCNKTDIQLRLLGGQTPSDDEDDEQLALAQVPSLHDMKGTYTTIKQCLSERFDNLVSSKELGAMLVFEPTNWQEEDIDALHLYGADEVNLLVENYRHSLIMNGCNIDNVLVQFNNLKLDATLNKYITTFTSFWQMIIRKKRDRYNDLLHLVVIIMAIPISTSNVERTFSAIKRILGDWRLVLKATTVEALLRITSEGVDPMKFDAAPVVERWRDQGPKLMML